MSGALSYVYEFITRPSTAAEAYQYLPQHGAILPILLINVTFALFVFRIGPWLMRNRESFNLKRVMMVYNITQILFNLFMVYLSYRLLGAYLKQPGGLGCIKQLPYDHPQKRFEMFCGLCYLANKFLDYSETIFMVLRKSFKQITFLHVYHHILMTTYVFLHIHFEGSGGHTAVVGMINAIVHATMYVYYLVSSMDDNIKKSLWWKKYITQLQLLQFVIDVIHQSWPLLIARNCNIKKVWVVIALMQALFMIYLFSNFYIKTYVRKQPGAAAALARKKLAEKKL